MNTAQTAIDRLQTPGILFNTLNMLTAGRQQFADFFSDIAEQPTKTKPDQYLSADKELLVSRFITQVDHLLFALGGYMDKHGDVPDDLNCYWLNVFEMIEELRMELGEI